MLVSHILRDKPTQGVLTVSKATSVSEAAAILSREKIGALMVSEDGTTPDGILSERDIVRELGVRGPAVLSEPVESIMTAKVRGCAPGDRAILVLQIMTDGRFRHMPVLEDGKMIGLVSIGDVVKARLEELANQAESMKSLIMGY
ncbi:CBS domain-containing protein [Maritimibacter sp. DP1N21-5]|uniref:CBS domain-containing protein n=1 Tax=Maritimibacter sp. DP1N21-5 TaxID=2836867 RepID=UPI001C43CD04|nr:CBS domain-containing protein [Maritimibacter sp. DP1N21-5]MBV7409998.1 CBS domain-containing protein [Maritimibacter sp. DP1N21-5]